MDKDLLFLFHNEIDRQSSYALMSVEYINEYFKSPDKGLSTDKLLWYHVQCFFSSTANLSKLLWGSCKETNQERKKLRQSLNISDDSLLRNRELRNTFEHYDERLVSWFESNESKVYVDSNIGPVDMISNLDVGSYLRNYDTSKGAVTYQGKEYKLQPLVNEIVMLNESVAKKRRSIQ